MHWRSPGEIFPKWHPCIRLHFYLQKFNWRWFKTFLQQVFRWHWFGRRCWIWGTGVLHPKIFVSGQSIWLICAATESDSHIVIDIGLPTGLTMIPSIGIAVRHTPARMKTNLCHEMAELADVDPESKNLVPNVLILSEIITTRILIIITKLVGGILWF